MSISEGLPNRLHMLSMSIKKVFASVNAYVNGRVLPSESFSIPILRSGPLNAKLHDILVNGLFYSRSMHQNVITIHVFN